MAHKHLLVALGMIAAASPVAATTPEPVRMHTAPTESAGARYCMRVEPATGSRIEYVRCWTREEWAEQGVDVDREWVREGVAVLR